VAHSEIVPRAKVSRTGT